MEGPFHTSIASMNAWYGTKWIHGREAEWLTCQTILSWFHHLPELLRRVNGVLLWEMKLMNFVRVSGCSANAPFQSTYIPKTILATAILISNSVLICIPYNWSATLKWLTLSNPRFFLWRQDCMLVVISPSFSPADYSPVVLTSPFGPPSRCHMGYGIVELKVGVSSTH